MMTFIKRAGHALRWRFNALFGTGAHLPSDALGTQYPVDDVADYYDKFTKSYLKATGPFLQAYRGTDTDALMEYYVKRVGISEGMTILDAGCGVGAPGIWLALKFPSLKVECLTNSPEQAKIALENAADAGVSDRLTVTLGDYHCLSEIYDHGTFDRALFLESLGHSEDVAQVLYGVRDVLKQGGEAYIKDFFQRRSRNPDLQGKIDDAVATINSNYRYHVMHLPDLIATFMETGFIIAAVTPPKIEPDLQLTIDFEHEAGRLTYPAFAKVYAVDWYEVVARRE
jgi:cyclopropane fatty-acyl-phospholipid synthase-like methyltransferase